MILVLPLHAFTLAVERHMVWLWPIVWAIGLVVNGFAFGFVGYSNAGGFCNIASGRGGRYFNAIFTFVPRGFVVVVILILYTHLFFFLRRTNLFSSMSHRLSSHDHGNHPGDAEENAFGTPSQLVGRDQKGSHPPNGILQNGLEQGPRRGSAATTTSSSALGGGSTVSGQNRTPDSYKASGEEDAPAVTLLGKNDIEMVECANFCRAHDDRNAWRGRSFFQH
ncbi:hypothetical protein CBOM_03005 [Ceraceosorus bombacis]|uniref:Uncharacterized protein n=1 Tax=Ceraceosorus bombacis TaxID=401625 RepID=A0A0P1BKG3_9BASI|nr:hypothetical protein CBOM_03005 [Ceraceosorus bombacis]